MATKTEVFREKLEAYLSGSKEKKGRILDAVCEVTHMVRKAAIRKFGNLQIRDLAHKDKRGRAVYYTADVTAALKDLGNRQSGLRRALVSSDWRICCYSRARQDVEPRPRSDEEAAADEGGDGETPSGKVPQSKARPQRDVGNISISTEAHHPCLHRPLERQIARTRTDRHRRSLWLDSSWRYGLYG